MAKLMACIKTTDCAFIMSTVDYQQNACLVYYISVYFVCVCVNCPLMKDNIVDTTVV